MPEIKPTGISREKLSWLLNQPLETKLEMLRHHTELVRLLVNEILEQEVKMFTGERYDRQSPHEGRYQRWGFNPGSLKIGPERLRLQIPRVFDRQEGKFVTLPSYERLKALGLEDDDDRLFNAVLLGLSVRDCRDILQQTDGFGLSGSGVSRYFVEESDERYHDFITRPLGEYDLTALFVDGKYLAKEQMVIALGVTLAGQKIPLDFIQTHTENAESIGDMLQGLIGRGLRYRNGLLCLSDGSLGIIAATTRVFGNYAVMQRCQWHKRENVAGYLAKADQETYRRRLARAYQAETYNQAKARLNEIRKELELKNMSAVRSLDEGFEETLTLHRLGLNDVLGQSFQTTNCLENLNGQLEKYVGKIKRWNNSKQRHRWVACALLEIEKKMRRVANYQNLHLLKQKLIAETAKMTE